MGLDNFTLSMPIVKIDKEQRIVYGIATQEVLDKQNEIVDYAASVKAFKNWEGNIREMHDPKRAVGKMIDLAFDDGKKQVMVGAKISRSADGENAWQKIKEGILAGFSIGGRIKGIDSITTKSEDGEDTEAMLIKDYDLTELSLVDNPACPTAKIVMVKSVGGQAAEVPYVEERVNDPRPSDWWMKAYQISPSQSIEKLSSSDNTSKMTEVKGDTMSDLEKVDYNVRPQDGQTATEQAVEPKRGVAQQQANALNDSKTEPLPGGQAESRTPDAPGANFNGKDGEEQQEMYNERNQNGSDAQEGVMPKLGAGASENSEMTGDPKDYAKQIADMVWEHLQVNLRGQRISSADQPTDLVKTDEVVETAKSHNVTTETPVDLTKFDGKVDALTQLVKDLVGRLEVVESQPAVGSQPKKFVTVDKSVDGEAVEDNSPEAEYEALIQKSEAMAKANPMGVQPGERSALAFELRKAARKLQQ